MTATNPPQDLKVITPEPPAVEPKKDYVDPGPPEDRILSPEETENFFKHGSLEPPEEPPTDAEKQQAQEAGDHFAKVPGEIQQTPSQTIPPLDPAAATAAVAQDQQQVVQPAVTPAAPAVAPAAAPAVAPAQAPLQVPVTPQQSPTELALQAQIQQLTTQVQTLTQGMAQQQVQQQPRQQPQQTPQFNLQIPAGYAEAISSEDPATRMQALTGLINGLAATVHQRTMQDVDTRLQAVAPVVQQQVQEAQSNAEIKRDMYGTYPELSGMQDMVVATASQLQGQGFGVWSPDYRDAIAERLSPLVPGLQQKVQQQRASRGVVPQQAVVPNLPQVQQPVGLPMGVTPTTVQGGVHVPAVVPGQPVIVRDAQGNYSTVHPQHQQQVVAGAQARPNGSPVDAGLQDIWSTLGY